MPTSRLVLALLALQALTLAGALATVAAPAPSPRALTPARTLTVAERPHPVTIALRRPAPPRAARPLRRPAPPRPVARRVPTHHRVRPVFRPRQVPRLTPQEQVDRAAARISGYRPGSVIWVLQAKDGYWGTADWYAHTIWISPAVPSNRLFDVVVHEWSHLQSVAVYGGDVDLAVREMNRYFGGVGLVGAERAADCMARLQGARWTHYTACADSRWRAGAARLLAGSKLV